jgi:hypothetical protein
MVCPPEHKSLLTLQDIEKEGVPIRTLRYHAQIGALKARKIGPRRWYVEPVDGESYLGKPISGNSGNADNLPSCRDSHRIVV